MKVVPPEAPKYTFLTINSSRKNYEVLTNDLFRMLCQNRRSKRDISNGFVDITDWSEPGRWLHVWQINYRSEYVYKGAIDLSEMPETKDLKQFIANFLEGTVNDPTE